MSFWNRKPRVVEVQVTVEKTVTETVLGSPKEVELYAAKKVEWISAFYMDVPYTTVMGYFHSCEAALRAHPGAMVKKVKLWQIGDVYLESLKVTNISHLVEDKPKVEKGRSAKP